MKSRQHRAADRAHRHGWTWGGFTAGGYWCYIRHGKTRTTTIAVKGDGTVVALGWRPL
jgi:hypothetical protein